MRYLALFLALGMTPLFSAQDAAAVGTWKLDSAKSKYSPGTPPASATMTIQEQSDGLKTTYQEVEADGSHNGYEYAASYDGKDYPLTVSGTPTWHAEELSGAEAVVLRHAGGNSYSLLLKNSKGVVMTIRSVVSKNGKVMTVTAFGADASGKTMSSVSVWDKQ
ncbi:MAG TPA: hypothetical protein VMB25_08895 [Bryobacteraceae bacterium]|nr:hypothetical protein [Bryobacteraceae bacterium]